MAIPGLAVFKGSNIRRMLHQGEWRFSVIGTVDYLPADARQLK